MDDGSSRWHLGAILAPRAMPTDVNENNWRYLALSHPRTDAKRRPQAGASFSAIQALASQQPCVYGGKNDPLSGRFMGQTSVF
jgi:hypothetical protein